MLHMEYYDEHDVDDLMCKAECMVQQLVCESHVEKVNWRADGRSNFDVYILTARFFQFNRDFFDASISNHKYIIDVPARNENGQHI